MKIPIEKTVTNESSKEIQVLNKIFERMGVTANLDELVEIDQELKQLYLK